MTILAPWSRVQSTSSGFITSMSAPVSIMPAVTSPGPVWRTRIFFGPSPCMRRPIALMLRTMSVTSSRTPGIEENSCSTPSICTEVTAAPCSEESRMRRSALPSVRPKPRSSGSATTVAMRDGSCPGSTLSLFGLIRACQFFCITDDNPIIGGGPAKSAGPRLNEPDRCRSPRLGADGEEQQRKLHAAPLRRPAPVVRNRRYVADRIDRETDGLQRAQGRLAARARPLHLDLEGAHAMLHGLAAGILGGHLRRIGRRFAAALETLRARGGPGDHIALGVGDGDHGVVEGGVHMRD